MCHLDNVCGSGGFENTNQYKIEHLKYIYYNNRLNSFKTFPKCFTTYDCEMFAEAGFFYTNKSDCVCCFYCNINLKNWKQSDNQLENHIVFSPNCPFIKMNKSLDFINDTLNRFVIST